MRIYSFVVALGLALTVAGFGASPAVAQRVNQNEFAEQLSAITQLSERAAKLAEQKANNPRVLTFAHDSVAELRRMNDAFEDIADREARDRLRNVNLDRRQNDMIGGLEEKLSVPDFERRFVAMQTDLQEDLVDLFRGLARSGDRRLEDFADNQLSRLERLRDEARTLAREIK